MRPEDEYNETNKRHTMPHPPDHIPDLDTTPTYKSSKDKMDKDKVYILSIRIYFFVVYDLLTLIFLDIVRFIY